MKAVSRRIARLEERFAPTIQDRVKKRLRVIVSRLGRGVPDLAKSTATRTLGSDGMLMERVELDGARALITTEKLEEWLCGFPVQKF